MQGMHELDQLQGCLMIGWWFFDHPIDATSLVYGASYCLRKGSDATNTKLDVEGSDVCNVSDQEDQTLAAFYQGQRIVRQEIAIQDYCVGSHGQR